MLAGYPGNDQPHYDFCRMAIARVSDLARFRGNARVGRWASSTVPTDETDHDHQEFATDPDKPYGPVGRDEFNRLGGYIIGLTNAIRALIEISPDPAAARAAVAKCFDTEAAMGQSFEYLDSSEREGLTHSVEEVLSPIRHDWLTGAASAAPGANKRLS